MLFQESCQKVERKSICCFSQRGSSERENRIRHSRSAKWKKALEEEYHEVEEYFEEEEFHEVEQFLKAEEYRAEEEVHRAEEVHRVIEVLEAEEEEVYEKPKAPPKRYQELYRYYKLLCVAPNFFFL